MKTYKEFAKSVVVESKIPTSFSDSVEATEFIENVAAMIDSDVMKKYIRDTDKMAGTRLQLKRAKISKAYQEFLDEFLSAGE